MNGTKIPENKVAYTYVENKETMILADHKSPEEATFMIILKHPRANKTVIEVTSYKGIAASEDFRKELLKLITKYLK